MKKMFFLSYLLLGSLIAFTACNDDDDDNSVYNNSLNYDGDSFKINEVWVDYDGQYEESEDLVRMDVDFKAEGDNVLRLSLVVKEGNKTPVAGTYTFDKNANEAMRIFRGWFENDEIDLDIKSGSCVVGVSGSTYTFDINVVLENNKAVTGKYRGTIKENEEETPSDLMSVTYGGVSYEIKGADVKYSHYESENITSITVDFGFEGSSPEVGMMFLVSGEEEKLVAGTYEVDKDYPVEPKLVRAWFDGQGVDVAAESGTCKVTVNGDIYILDFDYVMTNGKVMKGYYAGELKSE